MTGFLIFTRMHLCTYVIITIIADIFRTSVKLDSEQFRILLLSPE